jgi:HEAT repeat protein
VPNEIWGRSSGKAAIEALRAIGPAAVPAGIRALAHRHWHVRVGAAHALGLYGADAAPAIPALIEAMEDPYSAVRSMAGKALVQIGDAAVPGLSKLIGHPDWAVRLDVASALVRIDPNHADAFRTLTDGLRYLDPVYRDFVGGWGANQERWNGILHVERDGKLVHNREHGVRAQAARALAGLGPGAARALPDLIAVLRDRRYPDAARAAAVALGRIGSAARPALPALLETLASVEGPVRDQADQYLVDATCYALGKIGFGPAELPELYRMLGSQRPWYDSLPTAFSGAPDEAVARLRELVSGVDPLAARRAAIALSVMGPRASDGATLAALRRLLEHPDAVTRDSAKSALERLDSAAPQ